MCKSRDPFFYFFYTGVIVRARWRASLAINCTVSLMCNPLPQNFVLQYIFSIKFSPVPLLRSFNNLQLK